MENLFTAQELDDIAVKALRHVAHQVEETGNINHYLIELAKDASNARSNLEVMEKTALTGT